MTWVHYWASIQNYGPLIRVCGGNYILVIKILQLELKTSNGYYEATRLL